MLGMVPTVTHALPAGSIPDIRHTVPTPHSGPVSPHPESIHYLQGPILPPQPPLLARKPLCASVPRSPTRERAEWCSLFHLAVPLPASDSRVPASPNSPGFHALEPLQTTLISSNLPLPVGPLEDTTPPTLGVVSPAALEKHPAIITCISPAPTSLPSPGHLSGILCAYSSRIAGSWWPGPTHSHEAYPCQSWALTLARRGPDTRRSLWPRQGSQRQRGSGELQSTPTARSQRQPAAPARFTHHTALPTSAAAGGDPGAGPPPRPQRAAGPASGAGRPARGPAAAPRRPEGVVLSPPGSRRAPGAPARPPEPRARDPGAPRGRAARADGGRTAGAARASRARWLKAPEPDTPASRRGQTPPPPGRPLSAAARIPHSHTPPTHSREALCSAPSQSHTAHPVQAHTPSLPPTHAKTQCTLARTHCTLSSSHKHPASCAPEKHTSTRVHVSQ